MTLEKNLEQYWEEYIDDPEFLAEDYIIYITENISRIMSKKNISKSELARRLGTSQAYVTKILNGNPNMTILTIAKLTIALGEKIIEIPLYETSSEQVVVKCFHQASVREYFSVKDKKTSSKLSFKDDILSEGTLTAEILQKKQYVA